MSLTLTSHPPALVDMSALEHAILSTLAYSDIFDHPLTLDELHKFLTAPAERSEIEACASQMDKVSFKDGYYFLADRSEIIEIREGREADSRKAFRRAIFYGRIMGRLPFIRMAALTGSLAMLNLSKNNDMDYMLVVRPGRVWTARAFVLLFGRLARLFGDVICPNVIVSENALEWDAKNLYTAREFAQMIPVSGAEAHHRLRIANSWVSDILPNAIPLSLWVRDRGRERNMLQTFFESLLTNKLGDLLETWEMNRKIARFEQQAGYGVETNFTADICQGNFDHHGAWALKVYEERLSALSAVPGGKGMREKMTQVLFGQSYYLRFDPKLWDAMMPYPPLGTLYAASYIRAKGYDVALFDAMLAESEDEWAKALDEHQPQYAVIFEDNFNYLSKMCLLRMREAAFTMIRMAKERGCTVILCGADVTDHYEKYLEHGADYCIIGEGEETLGELLDQLSAGKEAGDVIGHVSRTTHHVTRRPDIKNLDALPFPAWDLVDIQKYKSIWLERHGYFSMNMVTTRGCPYHCNWCAKPIWGQRYNSRSPENVAAEMKWLKENFAPDHIWFADDIFGLKPNWVERFAKLLHEHDAVIPFKCLKRADLVTEKTARALADAGCKTVWIGAESGSQKILDAMDKGDKVEDIYRAAGLLHANGIEVGFFLQFGYPSETWADVQKTLKMVRECMPDDIGVSVSYPLPGTKFHERVKLELGEKQNWVDSDDLAMLYRGPFPQEFYRILHRRVHHEFRLRRAWMRRDARGLVRTPYYLLGMLRSEMRLRKYL